MIAGVHAWWQWATQALAAQTPNLELQNWLLCYLLPWVYWTQQAQKTQHSELKQRYQQASDTAARQLSSASTDPNPTCAATPVLD